MKLANAIAILCDSASQRDENDFKSKYRNKLLLRLEHENEIM